MTAREQAIIYYEQRYDVVGQWLVTPGAKFSLGDRQHRHCRFCGKKSPDVTFRKIAHAIPELLGNRGIIAYYECDECNQFFGSTIENDFGKWSKPMRTLSRIRGKTGVPTLKRGGDTGWRIEFEDGAFKIKSYEDDPFYTLDEAAKNITFKLKREPYTPVAVLKAFVKIGLTLMPEAEIDQFVDALRWIRHPGHAHPMVAELPVLYAFQPGPMRNDLLAALILRRKASVNDVPYAFLVLGYGNEVFQVPLPSRHNDEEIIGKPINIVPFPAPGSPFPERFPVVGRKMLDLTGRQTISGEEWPITMGFETLERPSGSTS